MTPSVTTYIERVLIVLNQDGTLKGAHQEALQQIVDSSANPPALISAQMLAAVPLDAATLAAILPGQSALAAQVQALTDQVTALTAERDKALADLAAAQSANASANQAAGVVTNYQLRAALIAAGLFDQVNAYVLALPADDLARQGWEYANTFDANSALTQGLVAPLAQLLGVSTDEAHARMTAIFAAAAAITG